MGGRGYPAIGDDDPAGVSTDGCAPLVLRPARDPLCFETGPLPQGVVGRVIRAYGEAEIQVSHLIPARRRRAVARHVIEHHHEMCAINDCLAARGWLGTSPGLHLVASTGA